MVEVYLRICVGKGRMKGDGCGHIIKYTVKGVLREVRSSFVNLNVSLTPPPSRRFHVKYTEIFFFLICDISSSSFCLKRQSRTLYNL